MKIVLAALAIAASLAGAAQASTVDNGGLPSWATKAFEQNGG